MRRSPRKGTARRKRQRSERHLVAVGQAPPFLDRDGVTCLRGSKGELEEVVVRREDGSGFALRRVRVRAA